MRRMKEAKLSELAADLETDAPADLASSTEVVSYIHEFIRLTRIEDMHDWPVDIGLMLELVFVLILPYVAHVSAIVVFEELLR